MHGLMILLLVLLGFSIGVLGQNRCFTKEEAAKVIESIKVPPITSEDKELRKELLRMVETQEKINQKIAENFAKNQKLIPEFNKAGAGNLLRLCQIIKEKGWLTKNSVREDGVEAMLNIINNNRAFLIQTEFYPILVKAAEQGLIRKSEVAAMVDSIRVQTGQPQLFGTQARIKGDLIYLNPLLNEEKVDEWRKQYDLPPLNIFIKQLEAKYLMNVLKSPVLISSKIVSGVAAEKEETNSLGISQEENEVVKIDTRLVSLNIRILNKDFTTPSNLSLNKEDFSVSEDGQEQDLAFFSTTDAPFDLVLLLDFSGSTIDKQGVIKQAAQRFIQVARPSDRVAVVAFTEQIKVIADLTTDKTDLLQKVEKIDITGGSRIWGAVKYTYDNIIKKESSGRRSAIVLMTDAIDSSRETNFAELFEIVKKHDTTIFPVYLDEGGDGEGFYAKIRYKARQSLWLLAEESGGTAYQVKKIKDLRGAYEQVVNDLGKVYSLGYEPKNEKRDGSWRSLTVKVKTYPDLITKTRRGYYAR